MELRSDKLKANNNPKKIIKLLMIQLSRQRDKHQEKNSLTMNHKLSNRLKIMLKKLQIILFKKDNKSKKILKTFSKIIHKTLNNQLKELKTLLKKLRTKPERRLNKLKNLKVKNLLEIRLKMPRIPPKTLRMQLPKI